MALAGSATDGDSGRVPRADSHAEREVRDGGIWYLGISEVGKPRWIVDRRMRRTRWQEMGRDWSWDADGRRTLGGVLDGKSGK